jgi:hypothetical protein
VYLVITQCLLFVFSWARGLNWEGLNSSMILQVGTFLVAFTAILKTLNKLSKRARRLSQQQCRPTWQISAPCWGMTTALRNSCEALYWSLLSTTWSLLCNFLYNIWVMLRWFLDDTSVIYGWYSGRYLVIGQDWALLCNEINVAKGGQDLAILVPVQVSTRNAMFTGSTPSPLDLHTQEGKRGSI